MANFLQSWKDFHPSKTQVFWVCVATAVATLIGGFGMAGWVTAARAQSMADEAADNARRELAIAVCVDDFMHARDVTARLAKLRSTEFYSRSDIISAGGFATMPDRKVADDGVASGCAAALDEVKLPAQEKAQPVSTKK